MCVQAKGFTFVNVDEGWFIGRDAKTLDMIADPKFFPSGMVPGAASWPQAVTRHLPPLCLTRLLWLSAVPKGLAVAALSAPLARAFGPITSHAAKLLHVGSHGTCSHQTGC